LLHFFRHTLSRLTSPLLVKTRDYVDEAGPKYKFYSFFVEAKHLVTWHRVVFATTTSFAVASLAYGATNALVLISCVFSAVVFSGRYAEYLLGGVMGDYLGATICVTEIYLLTVLILLTQLENHKEFVLDLMTQFTLFQSGSLTYQSLIDGISKDDKKAALFRFAAVGVFTTIWCSCVGHPPVFVRESVAAKGDTDEIRIALPSEKNGNQNKNALSTLDTALSNEKMSFKSRYDTARNYLDSLAKPVGSLGTLEDWAARLAVFQCSSKPTIDKVACLIFAGDHGVAKDKSDGGANCSAYPQAVTQKVLEALEYNLAGASVLAAANDIHLHVVDVGLAIDSGSTFGAGNVVVVSEHKVKGGTENFCDGPAMSNIELDGCILAGREETKRCIRKMQEVQLLVFGEVGIGNTTSSSALIAALTGEPVDTLCGSGATKDRIGDENIISNKIKIIEEAIQCHSASQMANNPTMALENVGGAEIAAIVGGILEASEKNIPVLVDGFIVTTAAMIAVLMSPAVCRILCFATRSTERGQQVAIDTIKRIAIQNGFPEPTEPALDMSLRMGEATGALMAVPLLRSAAAIISDLATLETVLKLELESMTC
jgi:nicotinate-nucleotide--dimethylbenzimidazole phosphoribosyltransferase